MAGEYHGELVDEVEVEDRKDRIYVLMSGLLRLYIVVSTAAAHERSSSDESILTASCRRSAYFGGDSWCHVWMNERDCRPKLSMEVVGTDILGDFEMVQHRMPFHVHGFRHAYNTDIRAEPFYCRLKIELISTINIFD